MPTTPYGVQALAGELQKIRSQTGGGRNGTLNEVWLKLCQRINAGHLEHDHAHQAVWEAITPWFGQPGGDGKPFTVSEARATMASAERGARFKPNLAIPEPGAPPDLSWLDLPRQAAPVVATPAPDVVPASPAAHDYSALYRGVTTLGHLPAPEPLIDGVLDGRTSFSIIGRDGVYKSFMALDWLARLSTGQPWFGHRTRQTKVLYVVGEGVWGLAARINAWQTAWQTDLDDDWFHVRTEPINLFRAGNAFADLLARIETERYGVIVVDTLARNSSGGDLNRPSDASIVIENLDRLRKAVDGGSVGFVGHTGKSDLDTRGASNLEDDLDLVWHMKRSDDDQDSTDTIIAKLVKRKDGPDGERLKLQPHLVAGTGSLVLQVAGGLDAVLQPARAPAHTLQILKLLAGSAASVDGLSPSALADGVGVRGKGSVMRALGYLLDNGWVEQLGPRLPYKITGPGRSRLAEMEEAPIDLPQR